MELLQLRYFLESAKNENFSQTARKYQVPTTSVSASVKRLENELGCLLFDRVSNRITLNSAGKRFYQSVTAVFRELDGAVEELSSENTDKREIRLLVRGMRRKITGLISEFSEKYAPVAFKLCLDAGEDHFEDYDIIIDEENEIYREYECLPLFDMDLFLKCAAASPLCGRKLTLSQLKNQSFISMGNESNMAKILARACEKAGFTPKISAICNDIECFERLIATGMGIGIGRAESSPAVAGGIKKLSVSDFHERYRVMAYYRKAEYYGNVKRFVDFLIHRSL